MKWLTASSQPCYGLAAVQSSEKETTMADNLLNAALLGLVLVYPFATPAHGNSAMGVVNMTCALDDSASTIESCKVAIQYYKGILSTRGKGGPPSYQQRTMLHRIEEDLANAYATLRILRQRQHGLR
jgi:hypothetical protein